MTTPEPEAGIAELQASVDRFYWSHGRCCAGCDWWRHLSPVAGECTRSAPISSADRVALLQMHNLTLDAGAGHALTQRDHVCGEFKDDFDWSSLPLAYRKRVGCQHLARAQGEDCGG